MKEPSASTNPVINQGFIIFNAKAFCVLLNIVVFVTVKKKDMYYVDSLVFVSYQTWVMVLLSYQAHLSDY